MIPSKQENFFGIIYFQGHNEGDHFYRVCTSIDIVSEKEEITFDIILHLSYFGHYF